MFPKSNNKSPVRLIPCPECKEKEAINVSLQLILSNTPLQCMHCGLEMNVDKNRSSQGIKEMVKLNNAVQKLDKVRNKLR